MAECYKTIEYPDRKAIAALYAAGAKAGQIAKEIGVAPRTIYAELMLVRLYAGEVILERITIDDVPKGLRPRVAAYLKDMGYTDDQSGI